MNISWGPFFIVAGALCGIIGWAVIELFLWLLSAISMSFT